jgi:hypothetical protein
VLEPVVSMNRWTGMKFDPMQYAGFPDATALDEFLPGFEVPPRLANAGKAAPARARRPRARPRWRRQTEPHRQSNQERSEQRWEGEGGSLRIPAAPKR